jgi:predicted  nucleic acid-binding Zn-ribbon protein
MKYFKTSALLILVFFTHTIMAQIAPKKERNANGCPLPVYKKGQTSAQVNEETKKYVECRKIQLAREQEEAKEAERRRQEKLREQGEQKERDRLNRQIDQEKTTEERRRESVRRADERQRNAQNAQIDKEKRAEEIRRQREANTNRPAPTKRNNP